MPFFKLNDVFAGRYVLVELIGEGDSSELWKAKNQLADDIVVVLKIFATAEGWNDEEFSELRQEFSLLQPLYHPHLLKAYQFDVWENTPYMVLPLCSMESLDKLLAEEGPFSERQLALVMSQIASALDALHSQEPPLLHQDVNPANIVASQPDYFMLADFGISSQQGHSLPKQGTIGKSVTQAYAPPERFDPLQKPNAAGDVFSLGVSLYEMCTNTLPWGGAGGKTLAEGESIPALPGHYSAELNELLQACMSVNRSERPSAQELHLRGKHFLETGHWNLAEQGNKTKKSLKKLIPYLLAAGVIALLLIGGYWAYTNNHLSIPTTRGQHGTASGDREQDIDNMIIATLEDELQHMKQRTRELEEENRRLMENKAGNNERLKNQDIDTANNEGLANSQAQEPAKEESQGNPVQQTSQAVTQENRSSATQQAPEPVLEEQEDQLPQPPRETTVSTAKPAGGATTSTVSPEKEKSPAPSIKELEQQLNKISAAALPAKERTAWKQETMAYFAEEGIRIVDETAGASRQYSASIFLNLLYKVPHTIVVKEVKSNDNNKVTELRLTMESER